MEYLIIAPVASVIFGITILVSLMAFSNQSLYDKLMLHPYEVARGQKIHTLITSGFIHKDLMHLMFNMFSYYFFAFTLEQTIGHWQFGMLYFVSLILSDMPTVLKNKENNGYYSLGASGAISAVIFGFILYYPLIPMGILFLPPQLGIPAFIFGILYLVYCSYASRHSRDNINHDAHLYGALSGLLIAILLNPSVVSSFFHQITEKVQSLLH